MKLNAGDGTDNIPVATNGFKLTSENIVEQYETPETKLLTDQQLQRVILLQQAKVLELQRKRLETDLQPDKSNEIQFELIGFNQCAPSDAIDI